MGSPDGEDGRVDGSHEIQHQVRITRPFMLQSTEVTQSQWMSVMGSNPSFFAICGSSCPVEKVSWHDASRYLNTLSRLEGYAECYDDDGAFAGLTCSGYRFPTDAEWEYAARAGSIESRYGPLDEIAWYEANNGGTTHPVAQKTPNAWGLYDMLGNVWEWTNDWYSGPAVGDVDPLGPQTGVARIVRGGGMPFNARRIRAAYRNYKLPADAFQWLGFRAARTLLE